MMTKHSSHVSVTVLLVALSLLAPFRWLSAGELDDFLKNAKRRLDDELGSGYRSPPSWKDPEMEEYKRKKDAKWAAIAKADPEMHRRMLRFRENYNKINSPLLIDGNRLYFVQPDSSLTIMNIGTGEVIARIPHHGRVEMDTLSIMGNLVVGEARYGFQDDFIADKRNGAFIEARQLLNNTPYQQHSSLLYYLNRSQLKTIDIETLRETRVGDVGNSGTFCIIGNLLYILKTSYSEQSLAVQDLADNRVLWTISPGEGESWMGMAAHRGRVHLFVGDREVHGKDKLCREVRVFGAGGEEKRFPATAEMFGGTLEKYFSVYTYQGVWYRKSVPTTFETYQIGRTSRQVLEEKYGMRSPYIQAVTALPGDAFAWLEIDKTTFSRSLNEEYVPANGVLKLWYKSDVESWSGTVNCADDFLTFRANFIDIGKGYHITGDEKYIIYATDSGKMECLDRKTGRSRWLYVFPRLYYEPEKRFSRAGYNEVSPFGVTHWGRDRDKWLRNYFADDLAAYRAEMSLEDVAPFSVDGSTEPPDTKIILDPKPMIRLTHDIERARLIAWLAPLTALVVTWFFLVRQIGQWISGEKRKRWTALAGLPIGVCVIPAMAAVFWYFGRYSRPTTALMLLGTMSALILICVSIVAIWKGAFAPEGEGHS